MDYITYKQKYLKYKQKYLALKGGADEDGVHIWLGGSFSPPTLGHFIIAEFSALYVHSQNLHPGEKITFHFVPVNDYYAKDSINCVTAGDRCAMLQIGADKLTETHKDKNIIFRVNTFEILVAEKEGEFFHKPIPSYYSIANFQPGVDRKKVYTVQGEDNMYGIVAGSWKKSYDLLFTSTILCPPRNLAVNELPTTELRLRSKINLDNLNKKEQSDLIHQPLTSLEEVLARIKILDFEPLDISSSDLRREINEVRSGKREEANLLRKIDKDVLEYIKSHTGNPNDPTHKDTSMYSKC